VIDLGVNGIKLHHLYVAQNTKLAELYKQGQIKLFTLEEYIPLVCDIIERLPYHPSPFPLPNGERIGEGVSQPAGRRIVIQRLTGELSGELLIAPKWNVSKSAIIRMIEEELTKRNSYQGKKYSV
jgi:radical SAM superfamily enzyme